MRALGAILNLLKRDIPLNGLILILIILLIATVRSNRDLQAEDGTIKQMPQYAAVEDSSQVEPASQLQHVDESNSSNKDQPPTSARNKATSTVTVVQPPLSKEQSKTTSKKSLIEKNKFKPSEKKQPTDQDLISSISSTVSGSLSALNL
jgi:hypothetical protein